MSDDHLSEETLSAVVDGAADDDALAHVAACAPCRERVARLRRAAAAIAAPPPAADEAVREAAIARAVAAHPEVVARAGWRSHRILLAAAAVVVAVMVAVPVLVAGRGNDDSADTALSDADVEREHVTFGGDLGAVDHDQALRDVLLARLEGDRASPAGAGGAAGGGGSASQLATDDAASEAAPAAAPDADCTEAAIEAGAGRFGTMRYSARLRYKGTPAQVLVFDAPSDQRSLPRRAVVMAEAGCQLLVVQSF